MAPNYVYVHSVKIKKNIYRFDVQATSDSLRLFQMFTGPLFQIKLHLLSTVWLSGFQSSLEALKSTE